MAAAPSTAAFSPVAPSPSTAASSPWEAAGSGLGVSPLASRWPERGCAFLGSATSSTASAAGAEAGGAWRSSVLIILLAKVGHASASPFV